MAPHDDGYHDHELDEGEAALVAELASLRVQDLQHRVTPFVLVNIRSSEPRTRQHHLRRVEKTAAYGTEMVVPSPVAATVNVPAAAFGVYV
jgi:hypothetical protein